MSYPELTNPMAPLVACQRLLSSRLEIEAFFMQSGMSLVAKIRAPLARIRQQADLINFKVNDHLPKRQNSQFVCH
jgi:hypothetical protein